MANPKVSFENTEIAFYSRSDRDLRKSRILFSALNSKFIVKTGTLLIKVLLKLRMPVKYLLKGTVFKQFCGGESIGDCRDVIEKLRMFNVGAILDYAVEGGDNKEDFDKTCAELLNTIDKAGQLPNIPFAVFKPSGIGSKKLMAKVQDRKPLVMEEEKSFEEIEMRFDRLCQRAFEKDVRLLIDSEESWFLDTVDEIAYKMMKKYNREKAIVFNTYQFYRKDMLSRLQKALHNAIAEGYFLGVKMVRGAYMDIERRRAAAMNYPDPIFREKKSTDCAFNRGLEYCIENISHIALCCGTHNEESSCHLSELIESQGLQRNDQRIYFAQLYGMSDHIGLNLAQAGFNVAKYVPYGPVEAVIPYLIRRAEENTSIAGQSSRELQLIRRELKRRKRK